MKKDWTSRPKSSRIIYIEEDRMSVKEWGNLFKEAFREIVIDKRYDSTPRS